MQLFVCGGNDRRSVVLNVQAGENIGEVLNKYQLKEGFPPDALRVTFQGKLLDHDKTLDSYGIKHGDSLNAIVTNKKRFRVPRDFYFPSSGGREVWQAERGRGVPMRVPCDVLPVLPMCQGVELTISESSPENRYRLSLAINRGLKEMVQIVGADGAEPRAGLFDIKSHDKVFQVAEYSFSDLKPEFEGEHSTVVSILSSVDMSSASSVHERQTALIGDAGRREAKYLNARAQLRKARQTILHMERTISARGRTIDEQQRATQELTNTIDMKDGIIQERDAAILSIQADNTRLGQQNATLEAERLRGDRLVC
mmetsp:Transcript_32142/g.92943  ORF Transcript_32142/g.92943 Transcript_32142/m.92943 type:complete len:312 (+) Transcript_32142:87-1022(+)